MPEVLLQQKVTQLGIADHPHKHFQQLAGSQINAIVVAADHLGLGQPHHKLKQGSGVGYLRLLVCGVFPLEDEVGGQDLWR
jgi:hypothetical protein